MSVFFLIQKWLNKILNGYRDQCNYWFITTFNVPFAFQKKIISKDVCFHMDFFHLHSHQFRFLFNFVLHESFLHFFGKKIPFDCKEALAIQSKWTIVSKDNKLVRRIFHLFHVTTMFPYFWCCVKINFNQNGSKVDWIATSISQKDQKNKILISKL